MLLEAFINGMLKRIAEQDASLSVPLRAGQLDHDQYKHHAGQLVALDWVRREMAEELKRLTQPPESPRNQQGDDEE